MVTKGEQVINREKIGKTLVKLRGDRAASHVAREIGISKQLLRAYETGICLPGDDTKKKIARYYGQTVGALFYDEGKMKSDHRKVKSV